jgi:hypothetical protein
VREPLTVHLSPCQVVPQDGGGWVADCSAVESGEVLELLVGEERRPLVDEVACEERDEYGHQLTANKEGQPGGFVEHWSLDGRRT